METKELKRFYILYQVEFTLEKLNGYFVNYKKELTNDFQGVYEMEISFEAKKETTKRKITKKVKQAIRKELKVRKIKSLKLFYTKIYAEIMYNNLSRIDY